MRFTIKSRVESLIKRDRILAAIHKLQRFTNDKEVHRLTYDSLNELESRFKQIEKDFKSKTIDYATYDREKSKIRSSVLDINNEIEDLKETRDRKFIWTWVWAILTGLLLPILGFLVPMWMDSAKECPEFEDKDCKLLVFNFRQSDDISPIAPSILEIFQTEDYYVELMSAEMDPVTENATRNDVKRKVDQCDASFGIYGSGERINGKIYVTVNSYKNDTLLADIVDEVRDTLVSVSETDNLVQQKDFRTMLNMMICLECYSCPVEEEELLAMIEEVSPEVRDNHLAILAQIQYRRGNLIQSESTLTRLINSMMGGIKMYAYRGKVRDDQRKYEPAFEDYSYYLNEKPENHNVRLKRFNSVYNLITTSEWQPKYASFIDIAAKDHRLLKGNIPNDQYRIAQQRLNELIEIKNGRLSTDDPLGPTIPDSKEKCDFTFNIKHEGQGVRSARINIIGLLEEMTDNKGTFNLRDVGCEEVLNRKLIVTKEGFLPYEAEVNSEIFNIELESIPVESAMCVFSGVVMNEKEEAIVSASVQVDGLPRTRTDRNGRFTFREEPCDVMEGKGLTIVANGYETYQSEIRDMEVLVLMKGETLSEPDPDMCSFSGYIMDVTGKPISGAKVSIIGIPEIMTNPRGYFISKEVNCNALPGLKYTVTAEGYKQLSEKIIDGQYKVEKTLTPETTSFNVAGRITNAINNQAIAGVTILLDKEPMSQSRRGGSFTFNIENQGVDNTRMIEFQKDGFHSKSSRVNINDAKNISIAMIPTRISGNVFDNGKPVGGASIKIKGLRTATTNRGGQYVFNIPDGFTFPESFKVSKSGYQSATIPMVKYNSITLTPIRQDILNVVVTKEEYNDRTRKWEYVPAQDASIIVDRRVVGKTGKDGRLAINMTGRLNQTVSIDIDGIDQISSPRLPLKVTFTKNGQVVNISHYVLK